MRRASNGEGTIRQRRPGLWEARYLGREGRGEKRMSVYGKTRDEVARKLRVELKARDDGLPNGRRGETFASFLATWLESAESSLRPQTWTTYDRHLRLHVIPFVGRIRLGQLGPHHLQELYQQRLEGGLSPTTVRHLHAIIHKALEQATRWGLVPRNVADLVDAPRMVRHDMSVLDGDGVRALLTAAAGDRLEALYVLAVTTGMRRGEVLALRWRDVDLDRSVLSVTGSLQRIVKGLVIGEPKTTRSRRQVALSRVAVDALERRRTAQISERLKAGPEWEDTGVVFTNELGRPIEPGNFLRRSYEPLLKRAGLPHLRFHDLRHTAATLMLSRGIHPKVASEMLGHSNIAITLDLYSHVTATMQRDAARTMDEIVAPGPNMTGSLERLPEPPRAV